MSKQVHHIKVTSNVKSAYQFTRRYEYASKNIAANDADIGISVKGP
jgi:hypothetical protein